MRTMPAFQAMAMLHARETLGRMLTRDNMKRHRSTGHQIPLDLRLRFHRDGAHGVGNHRIMDSKGKLVIVKASFFLLLMSN